MMTLRALSSLRESLQSAGGRIMKPVQTVV
jgi:hypothetical protein